MLGKLILSVFTTFAVCMGGYADIVHPCNNCEPGMYCEDGSCKDCGVGHYCTGGSAGEQMCSGNTVAKVPKMSQCSPCPDGTYSNSTHTECVVCNTGAFVVDNSNVCVACLPGQYANTEHTQCVFCDGENETIKGGVCMSKKVQIKISTDEQFSFPTFLREGRINRSVVRVENN